MPATRLVPRAITPLFGPLLATLALVACGGDADAGRPAFTTTVDSVGDTLVVHTVGDIPAADELHLAEVWRVGDADGDETTSFGRVHSLSVAADGSVYVFEASVPQFRHYAADGTLMGVLGAKGSGPGEYTRSNGVAVLSDGRVALWDAGNSRVNVYGADGAFLTQWMPPVQQYSTGANAVSALNDGGLTLRAYVRDTTLTREALGRVAWFLFDGEGTLRDTVLAPFYGDPPENLVARVEGNTSTRPVPFTATPQTALDGLGRVIGSPGAPYIVYLVRDGRPLRIGREMPVVPVGVEEREQQRASVTWGMRQTDPAWTWNGPEMPDTKPPVVGLRAALDDQLLVEVGMPSEPFDPEPPRAVEGQEPRPVVSFRSPSVYELFGADGRLRGRFRLPTGATLHALRGSDAWGTVTDSLDIPYLVRWRLEEPTTIAP